ncbi:hypothetical protein Scel_72880 [Streptomyces cellostaticus]|nr:hypothetical protein Scel_72880 [Streptomyces cellostaticus]
MRERGSLLGRRALIIGASGRAGRRSAEVWAEPPVSPPSCRPEWQGLRPPVDEACDALFARKVAGKALLDVQGLSVRDMPARPEHPGTAGAFIHSSR